MSADNDDQTANNMWLFLSEVGIDRAKHLVTWNVVPWYVGDDNKIGGLTPSDLRQSRPATEQLLDLLPDLRAAVLLGKEAAKGWRQLSLKSSLPTLECPHPSNRNLNSRPAARPKILDVLTEARLIAETE